MLTAEERLAAEARRNREVCPMTKEKDCKRCSGEYCEFHGIQSCDCCVLERHGLGPKDLENDCI